MSPSDALGAPYHLQNFALSCLLDKSQGHTWETICLFNQIPALSSFSVTSSSSPLSLSRLFLEKSKYSINKVSGQDGWRLELKQIFSSKSQLDKEDGEDLLHWSWVCWRAHHGSHCT
uniref:Uncharacterized protein n=1 Tax=Vitis vinifera TaxID=29760 RepID=F6H5N2_VITVI